MVALNEVAGVVAVVNDKGVKLDGADSWLNWSRYAAERCRPERGARVRCLVDGQGFLRAVELVRPEMVEVEARGVDRDRVITRQWAVNAATAILASGGRAVEPGAAVKLAGQLEAWAVRSVS